VIGRLRRFLPVLPTTLARVLTRSANEAGASTDFVSQAERKAPISYCKTPTNAATNLAMGPANALRASFAQAGPKEVATD